MIPPWQLSALKNIPNRHIAVLWYQNEPVTMELIGKTPVAIVRSHHKGRDLRNGDVVWIKEMMGDRVTIKSLQLFSEGLPGAARGLDRVHQVEEAKGKRLTQVARELIKLLSVIENTPKGEDDTLVDFLGPHLVFMDLFHATNPTDVERMNREDVAKIRAMLKACCTIEDRLGRRNPESKVLRLKGTRRRMDNMSERRMAMANKAGMVSATLNILMNAFHALVAEVHTEITSKLNAKSWNYKNPQHMQWLERFGGKLEDWASEMGDMDMHPFARDAKNATAALTNAAQLIKMIIAQPKLTEDNRKVMIDLIRTELELVQESTNRLLARFQLAELLRVVGTARDPRVQQLGIAITKPNWNKIVREFNNKWGLVGIGLLHVPEDKNAANQEAYDMFRRAAKIYDDTSRAAA